MPDKSRALVGIAGVYFTAAELTQQKYIAIVTSRNTEGIDILASNLKGSKMVSIQVKTSGAEQRIRGCDRSWHFTEKYLVSPKLFWCLLR